MTSKRVLMRVACLKLLANRTDISTFDDMGLNCGTVGGAPDILGLWRRQVEVRSQMGQNSFQPFETIKGEVIGQPFGILLLPDNANITVPQAKWRKRWLAFGGLYYEIEDPRAIKGMFIVPDAHVPMSAPFGARA